MARSWYSFQNAASSEGVSSMSIFDEIGTRGISAKSFITDMRALNAPEMDLFINSSGGSVFDGVAIFNAVRDLVKSGTVVNVTVLGVAASIASVIALAGTTVKMPANTFMMIHNPWGAVEGTSSDMRDYADLLDKVTNNIVSTYVSRTGKTEAEIRDLLATDTWLSAEEALALGLCDEVTDAYAISACFDLDRMPDKVKAVFNAAKLPVAEEVAGTQALADTASAEAQAAAALAAEVPFADQVSALCKTAGVSAYAGLWAMAQDATVTTVQKAIADARQITALCALVKLPNAAESIIRARKSVAQARIEIANMLATEDERLVTDTTTKNSTAPIHNAGPSAVRTADIWAARRK